MATKKEIINTFLNELRNKSINEFGEGTNRHLEDMFSTKFTVFCRKCGSGNIYFNFEDGTDYGGYTGYSPGQKIIKCKDCGNTASYWN